MIITNRKKSPLHRIQEKSFSSVSSMSPENILSLEYLNKNEELLRLWNILF